MKNPISTATNPQNTRFSYRRISIGFLWLTLLFSTTAIAQETDTGQQEQEKPAPPITYKDTGAHNYFFASGGKQALRGEAGDALHLGAGIDDYHDVFGVGFALELGASIPIESRGTPSGVVSFNFPKRFFTNERVQPFITGGYSQFVGKATKARWNYGGGVLWWVEDTWGLRLEARDHVPITSPDQNHSWQFRVALIQPREEGTKYLPNEARGKNTTRPNSATQQTLSISQKAKTSERVFLGESRP
jgi:hypothetical protein